MLGHHPFLRASVLFVGIWFVLLATLLILYFGGLREWQMTWGATDEEVARAMAGDELLEDPGFAATRVVEIEAPPERVWPWLVQMGFGKAGLYTFANLDSGGAPRVERILPEHQDLQIGDAILPLLEVAEMEPNRSMLWVFQEGAGQWEGATWSWGLYETEEGGTRLVSRLRQEQSFGSLPEAIGWIVMDPMEICMMRTTLLGIKRRAEG